MFITREWYQTHEDGNQCRNCGHVYVMNSTELPRACIHCECCGLAFEADDARGLGELVVHLEESKMRALVELLAYSVSAVRSEMHARAAKRGWASAGVKALFALAQVGEEVRHALRLAATPSVGLAGCCAQCSIRARSEIACFNFDCKECVDAFEEAQREGA